MDLRIVTLSLALVGCLVFGLADTAHASPIAPSTAAHLPVALGPVHVGVGVGIGIGGGTHYGPSSSSGYWTYRTERVWQPQQILGYDQYGRPLVQNGHWTTQTVRVWVSTYRAPTYRYRARPRIHVGLGFRIR